MLGKRHKTAGTLLMCKTSCDRHSVGNAHIGFKPLRCSLTYTGLTVLVCMHWPHDGHGKLGTSLSKELEGTFLVSQDTACSKA